jgi:hypothetical protein
MQELQNSKLADAYRLLMTAVIERALADIKGVGLRCKKKEKDQDMAFILSETCEAYCLELMIDYERVRKEAVGFYQRFIASTDQITIRKKYTKRSSKHLERVQIRKVAGKRRITIGR